MQRITEKSSNSKHIPLKDILSTKDGFDLFANHLVNEFSTENLFFLFEMMNVKREILDNGLVATDDIGVTITICKHTLKSLSKDDSSIRTLNSLKQNLNHIMDEYIYESSENSINIAAATRYDIICNFHDIMKHSDQIGGQNHLDVSVGIDPIKTESVSQSNESPTSENNYSI